MYIHFCRNDAAHCSWNSLAVKYNQSSSHSGSTVALHRWFFSVLVEAKQCRLVPCRAGSSVSQSILTTQPQLSPLGNDEERQESDYHRFRAVQLNYFNLNINIESNRMFFLFHKPHILKRKSLQRLLSGLNRFIEKVHKLC